MKQTFTGIIGVGLVAIGIGLDTDCRAGDSAGNPDPAPVAQVPSAPAKLGHSQTYLFMDWNDIDKGRVVPVYDESRLTEDAKKSFANLKKDWNIDTRIGKHGTHQYHVAHGIQITPEVGKKTPRFLVSDKPWEELVSGGNIIFENGKYRCWYAVTMPKVKPNAVYPEEGRGMEMNGFSTCYAESDDGFHWVKPALHVFHFNGSTENNIISPLWLDTPFLDEHGSPEQRYKASIFDELPPEDVPKGAGTFLKFGLYGMVSPDGYHWTRLPKPMIKHFADTQNTMQWDESLKKYVGYFRGHTGGRSVTRAETEDFNNWPMPTTVFCTGPDETAPTDYYSPCYTTYPGMPTLRLMFPCIYHLDKSAVDVRMAISRDGYGWNRYEAKPVIELGGPNEWDCGMIFAQPNLLRLPDGRLALSYDAFNHGHDTDFSESYKDLPKAQTGMAWVTWEDGRLAGVEAQTEGDFYASLPIKDLSAIEINARTEAHGRVEVELVEKETPIPGYSFADCVPLTGDNLWKPIRFKDKDVSELVGRKFQVHFRLVHAKVFGYRTYASADHKK